jgi:hypothetical protein
MMTMKKVCAVAAFALVLPMTVSQSNAAPLASGAAISSAATQNNSDVQQVYWRGRRGWGGGAGVGIGLAAGALIGGAIAAGSAPYYGYGYGPGYYGPAYAPASVVVGPAYGGDAEAYCMQRYKSYDPASGTYLNYDGNRYPCP